jgi:NADH:ubiquinone oxidoreductase subunit E
VPSESRRLSKEKKIMHELQNLEALNPDLTAEVISKVDERIAHYGVSPGSLIPVLADCQSIVGYIPIELQEYIGKALNIPGSTVYGVVTFYSFFSMVPRGRHTIKVCMGTACYVRGTQEILNWIMDKFDLEVGQTTEDRRFTLEAVRCLGACGLAPVIVVDEDTHGAVRMDKMPEIVAQYE